MCVLRFDLLRLLLPISVLAGLCVPQVLIAQEADTPFQLQSAAETPRTVPQRHRDTKRVARKHKPSDAIPVRVVRTVRIDPAQAASLAASQAASLAASLAATSAAPFGSGRNDEQAITAAKPATEPRNEPHAAPAASSVESDVKTFCGNVGRAASDARVAWQAAKLLELETALKGRIDELEAKAAEHRTWLMRREEAQRRADDAVVAIYARMRPDSAASQLASLDDATAAAVLMKLNPRNAGAILSEIPAERAARLTDAMAGSRAKSADDRKPS